MSTKKRFHLKRDGSPAPCPALIKCRLTDADGLPAKHFDTMIEARASFEATMSQSLLSSISRKGSSRATKRASKIGAMVLVATFSLTGCGISSIMENPGSHLDNPEPSVSSTVEESPSSEKTNTGKVKDYLGRIADEVNRQLDERAEDKSGSDSSPETGSSNASVVYEKLEELEVRSSTPEREGYNRDSMVSRSQWEKARQGVLERDLGDVTFNDKGQVATGVLVDPYGSDIIFYERGAGPSVDVDHVVSLGDAWDSGLSEMSPDEWTAIATDPDNLVAVSSSLNRSKGDKNASGWLPPNSLYVCEYVYTQAKIKAEYSLTVTQAELDSMFQAAEENC